MWSKANQGETHGNCSSVFFFRSSASDYKTGEFENLTSESLVLWTLGLELLGSSGRQGLQVTLILKSTKFEAVRMAKQSEHFDILNYWRLVKPNLVNEYVCRPFLNATRTTCWQGFHTRSIFRPMRLQLHESSSTPYDQRFSKGNRQPNLRVTIQKNANHKHLRTTFQKYTQRRRDVPILLYYQYVANYAV